MPEAATDTAPPSPPSGGSTAVFDSLTPPKELLDQLVSVKEREFGAKEKLYQEQEATLSAHRARVQNAFNAEGVGPDTLPQKWDEASESRKHAYDPIEAFGSFGSVFGILASAFTHLPADSALNAAASAMTAIKQGKTEDYKRAYQAWKDNTELALKRHQIQHQAYEDAIKLLSVDMQLGQAKLQQLAARFGDQATLLMIQHGMLPEWYQLQESRAKAAKGVAESHTAVDYEQEKRVAYLELQDANKELAEVKKSGDEGKIAAATQKWISAKERQRDVTESFEKGGLFRGMSAETQRERQIEVERANQVREGQGQQKIDLTAERQKEEGLHKRNMEAIATRKGDQADAVIAERERHDRAMEGLGEKRIEKAGVGGGHSPIAQDFEALKKKYLEDVGPGKRFKDEADAIHQAAQDARRAPISGENLAKRQEHISSLQVAKNTIDHLEGILKRVPFAVGMPGYATRFSEAIGNMLGNKSTEYFKVKGDIERLQIWGQAQMNLSRSSGRPLKANEAKLYSELAGLNWGDTTPRVVERYREIKNLYDEFQHIESDIMEGKWTNPTTQGAPAEKPGGKEPFWRAHARPAE